MVSYQTFVKIGYDVADRKGATFDGIKDGADFTSELAMLWNENKEEYKQLTEKQARTRLKDVVTA